ncbi:hypothetical protein [Soonwooa sp.]|uniref:hypothetical protein n=1 Tax=Soonwooa sp. TaxID=1938592 RepID=UPI0028972E8A|nr:hypothetical protein [Soonwooa sp.]
MRNLILFGTFFLFQFSYSQKCEPLQNGKYKLIPNKQFEVYPEYIFKIKNDQLISLNLKSLKRDKFLIRTNENCALSFISTKKEKEDPNELEITKILKKQKSYYTFKKVAENKYEFVNRVDLHIMIYDGIMIKL